MSRREHFLELIASNTALPIREHDTPDHVYTQEQAVQELEHLVDTAINQFIEQCNDRVRAQVAELTNS